MKLVYCEGRKRTVVEKDFNNLPRFLHHTDIRQRLNNDRKIEIWKAEDDMEKLEDKEILEAFRKRKTEEFIKIL